MQTSGWVQDRPRLTCWSTLARETEAQGTDAKAVVLLELIYKLQQEENDLDDEGPGSSRSSCRRRPCWQASSKAGFRPCSTAAAHLDTAHQGAAGLSRDVRALVSIDAGGEGLNPGHGNANSTCQVEPDAHRAAHWPRTRIGQRHVVRAINFVLKDTVEHRVRQVLETKLEVIAQGIRVDKASDVMDSVEAEAMFDEVFVQGLQDLRLDRQGVLAP